MRQTRPWVLGVGMLGVLLLGLPVLAHAATTGGGLPWETVLERLQQSLTGPVARALGVIAVVIAGLGYAFGEGGPLFHRLAGIVFGLAVVFSASTFVLTFFGAGSGLAF